MKIEISKINTTALYMLWLINQAGYEARICGGAVRDILMGVIPKDWDIATTALPEQVMEIMSTQGIKVIPTGLQHGTVTAIKDSVPYEITTLRIDVVTDGRYAEVEFTDDWELDASRRDFTINAMYMDEDGTVYDYHDGLTDLENKTVKFVGDAETRIKEDYLRIMRYFRFSQRISLPISEIDSDTFTVVQNNISGLKTISGERIWDELKKIFDYGYIPMSLQFMIEKAGLFNVLELDWVKVFKCDTSNVDPAMVLALACHSVLSDELVKLIDVLENKFHVSASEIEPVKFVLKYNHLTRTKKNAYELLAFNNKRLVVAWLAVRETYYSEDHYQLVNDIKNINVPKFPVSGKDLMDVGVPTGPVMGKIIHELKLKWASTGFVANKDYLLNQVRLANGVL